MTVIHVDTKALQHNAHIGKAEKPVIQVYDDEKSEKENVFGVEIDGPCRVVYSVRKTHDGAHVWIETDADVIPIGPVRFEP